MYNCPRFWLTALVSVFVISYALGLFCHVITGHSWSRSRCVQKVLVDRTVDGNGLWLYISCYVLARIRDRYALCTIGTCLFHLCGRYVRSLHACDIDADILTDGFHQGSSCGYFSAGHSEDEYSGSTKHQAPSTKHQGVSEGGGSLVLLLAY